MGFFDTVDTDAQEYEAPNMDPIPHGAIVQALVEDVELKWTDEEDEEKLSNLGPCVIKVKARVFEPEAYNNRVVFFTFKMWHPDQDKANRNKQQFVALDNQLGGEGIAFASAADDEELATDTFIDVLDAGWVQSGNMALLQIGLLKPKDGGDPLNYLLGIPAPGTETSEGKKEEAKAKAGSTAPPKPPGGRPKPPAKKPAGPPKPPSRPKPKAANTEGEIPL